MYKVTCSNNFCIYNCYIYFIHILMHEFNFLYETIDLSWNWISSRLEWIRSSRSIEDKCCSKSSILECGRPRSRRGDRAGSFCADPEDILLSAVAAESVGTAVGGCCCHRNDRKTKREPRTRLGVNLIFYSAAAIVVCASTSTFELGPRPGPGAAGCVNVVGQRHRAT